MKPIETRYKGYRFRSRLEARWGVFFDALGLAWEYEPEGMKLNDGTWYLPDFRVTSHHGIVAWYEIKPRNIKSDDKFRSFQESVLCEPPFDVTAMLLSGDPLDAIETDAQDLSGIRVCPRCGVIAEPASFSAYFSGDEYEFTCIPCDMNTPSQGEIEGGIFCNVKPYKGALLVGGGEMRWFLDRIRSAAEAARGARFEHGECGAA